MMLGLAEPSTIAMLSYMGIDMFDDSLPRAAGLSGIMLIPEAEIVTGKDESEANVRFIKEEAEKVRIFIGSDRLRELVVGRADLKVGGQPPAAEAQCLRGRAADVEGAINEKGTPTNFVGVPFCSKKHRTMNNRTVFVS